MKRLALTIALALPQMAGAQSDPFMDLTLPDMSEKTVEPSPYGCPSQPMPAWKDNLDVRESFKGVLLTNIYDAIWIRNVARDGTCNCENRVPPWDEANLIYETVFANMGNAEQMRARDSLTVANNLRMRAAHLLCEKELR